MTAPDKPMDGTKEWFKQWFFIPYHYLPITITDWNPETKKSFHRELRDKDFMWDGDSCPNIGMLTYVGITEIWKEIDRLEARVEFEKTIRETETEAVERLSKQVEELHKVTQRYFEELTQSRHGLFQATKLIERLVYEGNEMSGLISCEADCLIKKGSDDCTCGNEARVIIWGKVYEEAEAWLKGKHENH